MQSYNSKEELIDEIIKRKELFINEFESIKENEKDIIIDEIDRTPAQMISYQLGWMNLILFWEDENKKGIDVKTPSKDYKWNNLGGLYEDFYKQYEKYSLEGLIDEFNNSVDKIIDIVKNLSDEEFFESDKRQWASSTKSNWPIWKWIHINTVAPFKTFRTKIRKWKKLKN